MTNFTHFYRETASNVEKLLEGKAWDHVISAYTSADRVLQLFDMINAQEKHWLVFNEYGYQNDEIPDGAHTSESWDEAEYIIQAIDSFGISNQDSVCIDSTGFIRPYLAFLLLYLYKIGYKKIDVIYTEPKSYQKREKTDFCLSTDLTVRQIRGFEGNHSLNTSDDVLLVNSGYDSDLIVRIAENKNHAKKIQLFGFPSLRADMFQQNVLRAHKAHESIGISIVDENSTILAPANDPFATAHEIQLKVESLGTISNLYMSPLATKAQLIGMVLYHILGNAPCPTSIIFPFSRCYSQETSIGTARTWLYTLEFD